MDASTICSILNWYSGDAINDIEEIAMNIYQWPSKRQTLRRVNHVERVEATTHVFKAEMSVLRKHITKCMKIKEDVQEVIQMKYNEVRVKYPPEEINYAGGSHQCIRVVFRSWNMTQCKGDTMAINKGDK